MTDPAPAAASAADQPLAPPSPQGGLLEVFRRRYLLKLIVRRQLAQQYSASLLGFAWSYVQPVVRFFVYFFAVGMVLRQSSETQNYAVHLFCGLVMVHFFNEAVGGGTRSIWQMRRLVTKMAMPREVFPLSAVTVAGIHTFPQLLVLGVACAVLGWQPDATGVAAGLLGIAMLALMGTAFALFFSAANVFFRDFQNVVGTVTGFMHFMVPMIYPYTRVSESSIGGTFWEELYLANPVAEAVLLLQRCFWAGTTDDPAATAASDFPDHLLTRGLVMLGVGVVLLAIAQLVFRRLEDKFPERL